MDRCDTTLGLGGDRTAALWHGSSACWAGRGGGWRSADGAGVSLVDPQRPGPCRRVRSCRRRTHRTCSISCNWSTASRGAGGRRLDIPAADRCAGMVTDNASTGALAPAVGSRDLFRAGVRHRRRLAATATRLSVSADVADICRGRIAELVDPAMNGIGSVTLVPDLAYVDVRAISGVKSMYGGLGGIGAVGAPAGQGQRPNRHTELGRRRPWS